MLLCISERCLKFSLWKRRASELSSFANKGGGSGVDNSVPMKDVRLPGFELVLSDPLVKDGFMVWPLFENNAVGFVPGKFITSSDRALLQVVHNL